MNEDEAFIRAIVDSPGDDTPRLVYADWLDDRDDPRGPYLRAEHGWAATHDPGERDALRQLAKALDPVWVARVSRPPVGVCCDHVRFVNTEPKVDRLAIHNYEQEIEVELPPDYRAFLLNYNGGVPTPNGFPVPGGRKGRLELIQSFFPFTLARRRPTLVPDNLGDAHDRLYGANIMGVPHTRRPFLPVAWFGEVTGLEEDADVEECYGNRVLLGIRGPRCGELHMIQRDHYYAGHKTRLLAKSFAEFLASIRTPNNR